MGRSSWMAGKAADEAAEREAGRTHVSRLMLRWLVLAMRCAWHGGLGNGLVGVLEESAKPHRRPLCAVLVCPRLTCKVHVGEL